VTLAGGWVGEGCKEYRKERKKRKNKDLGEKKKERRKKVANHDT